MLKKPFQKDGLCSKTSDYWKSWDFGKIESRNRNSLLAWYCTKNQWTQDSIIYDNQSRRNTFEICSWLQQNIGKKKGCKSVPIAGSTDKRMITATFSITLTGKFLPIHLIYSGKTKNIPAVSFPSDFVISANETHYSNEREALNMLENVIIPYVEKQLVSRNLDFDHPALLIMDVFKGQMTRSVGELLNENAILLEKVPSNLTYLFQSLEVQGVPNGYVKRFMKKKFML